MSVNILDGFDYYKVNHMGNENDINKWSRQIYCADILKDQGTVDATNKKNPTKAGGTDIAKQNLMDYVSSELLSDIPGKIDYLSSTIRNPVSDTDTTSYNLTNPANIREFETILVKSFNDKRNPTLKIRDIDPTIDIYDMFFKDAGKHSHLLDDGLPQILITTPGSFSDPASAFKGTSTKPSFYWPPPDTSVTFTGNFVNKLTGYNDSGSSKFNMSITQKFKATYDDPYHRKPGFTQKYVMHVREPGAVKGHRQKDCDTLFCPPIINDENKAELTVEMEQDVVNVETVDRTNHGPLLSSNAQIDSFTGKENALATLSKEFGDTLQTPYVIIFNKLYELYGGDPDTVNLIANIQQITGASPWNPTGIFSNFCNRIEVDYVDGQIVIRLVDKLDSLEIKPGLKPLKNVFITVDLCVLYKGFSSGQTNMHYTGTSVDFRGKFFPLEEELTKKEALLLHIKNIRAKCSVQLDIIHSILKNIGYAKMHTTGMGLEIGGNKYNILIFIMQNFLAKKLADKFKRNSKDRLEFVVKEITDKRLYYEYIISILNKLEIYFINENPPLLAGKSTLYLLYAGLLHISTQLPIIGTKWYEYENTPGECHLLNPDELFEVSKKRVSDSIRDNTLVNEYIYNLTKQTLAKKIKPNPKMLMSAYKSLKGRVNNILSTLPLMSKTSDTVGSKKFKQSKKSKSIKLKQIGNGPEEIINILSDIDLSKKILSRIRKVTIKNYYIPPFPTPYKFIKNISLFKTGSKIKKYRGKKKSKTHRKKKQHKEKGKTHGKKKQHKEKGNKKNGGGSSSNSNGSKKRLINSNTPIDRERSNSDDSKKTRKFTKSTRSWTRMSKLAAHDGDASAIFEQSLKLNELGFDGGLPDFDREGIIYDILMGGKIQEVINAKNELYIHECKSLGLNNDTAVKFYKNQAKIHVDKFWEDSRQIFEEIDLNKIKKLDDFEDTLIKPTIIKSKFDRKLTPFKLERQKTKVNTKSNSKSPLKLKKRDTVMPFFDGSR